MAINIHHLDRLTWRKLARFCTDTKVPSHQRKLAEKRLSRKVEGLTLGERIALARIAPRAVLGDLARLLEPEVISALLGNPRTTCEDVTDLLQDDELPPDALRTVAEHHRWGDLVPVRIALATHRSTPVHTALKVLEGLPREEIRRLLDQDSLPPVLEVQARRLQESDTK